MLIYNHNYMGTVSFLQNYTFFNYKERLIQLFYIEVRRYLLKQRKYLYFFYKM